MVHFIVSLLMTKPESYIVLYPETDSNNPCFLVPLKEMPWLASEHYRHHTSILLSHMEIRTALSEDRCTEKISRCISNCTSFVTNTPTLLLCVVDTIWSTPRYLCRKSRRAPYRRRPRNLVLAFFACFFHLPCGQRQGQHGRTSRYFIFP